MNPLEIIYKIFTRFIENNWFTFRGLLATLGIELILLTVSYPTIKPFLNDVISFLKPEHTVMALYVLICISTALIWLVTKSIPTNPENKIGVVLAIKTENSIERIRIKNDLGDKIQHEINYNQAEGRFNLIVLNQYHSSKIGNQAEAVRALREIGAHFIVFGACETRKHNGSDVYVLNTQAIVVHKELPRQIQSIFQKEFSSLYATSQVIPVQNELAGFTATRLNMEIVAQYIIAQAASFSLDYELAYEIISRLRSQVQGLNSTDSSIDRIKKVLPRKQYDLALQTAGSYYLKYRLKKDKADLEQAKLYIDRAESAGFKDYYYQQIKAIYTYLTTKDVAETRNLLTSFVPSKQDVRNHQLWCISMAFISACDSNINKIEKYYRLIDINLIGSLIPIIETEAFINDVIETDSSNPCFHYCLGYINYKFKKDYKLAKIEFEAFVTESKGVEPKYIQKVEAYLAKIESKSN